MFLSPTMSHDNSINKLQEFCQKNKLCLPCYTDELVINGIFKVNCSVIIQGKEIIGKGDGFTKKDARKSAAAQCMTIITSESQIIDIQTQRELKKQKELREKEVQDYLIEESRRNQQEELRKIQEQIRMEPEQLIRQQEAIRLEMQRQCEEIKKREQEEIMRRKFEELKKKRQEQEQEQEKLLQDKENEIEVKKRRETQDQLNKFFYKRIKISGISSNYDKMTAVEILESFINKNGLDLVCYDKFYQAKNGKEQCYIWTYEIKPKQNHIKANQIPMASIGLSEHSYEIAKEEAAKRALIMIGIMH